MKTATEKDNQPKCTICRAQSNWCIYTTPAPKAQTTEKKQKDREFALRFCFLGMSVNHLIKSHQHGRLNRTWTRTTPTDMLMWIWKSSWDLNLTQRTTSNQRRLRAGGTEEPSPGKNTPAGCPPPNVNGQPEIYIQINIIQSKVVSIHVWNNQKAMNLKENKGRKHLGGLGERKGVNDVIENNFLHNATIIKQALTKI